MQYIITSEGKALFLDLDPQTCYMMYSFQTRIFKRILKFKKNKIKNPCAAQTSLWVKEKKSK